ncbi:hypothetical protein POTOM_017475 [Populus tomentosa]|uniref:Protein kinase domain-containing protein n=1 Tax=Populus tomentosa TaxID=118781 RepID=A0A8X8D6P0_POPTO|nr:hypothetical protein POTOM_017475 [Populus tomentosa]
MAIEEEDVESCGSRAVESYYAIANPSSRHHHQRQKLYNEVLKRIQDSNFEEMNLPGFDDNTSFQSLTCSVYPALNRNSYASVHLDPAMKEDAQKCIHHLHLAHHLILKHFKPVDIMLMMEMVLQILRHVFLSLCTRSPFKLLMGQNFLVRLVTSPIIICAEYFLTSLFAEIGLNIQEAHAFSIVDGFSLDIFVVDGWLHKIIARLTLFAHCTTWSCAWEPTEELRNALEKEILKSKIVLKIPSDGTNVWEIDTSQLKVENKVASGSYGDLYRGIYCSQEVAIKVLKPERVSREMLREFY